MSSEDTSIAAVEPPKVRKVRDSKLQRMKLAFLTKDENGHYKLWSINALMDVCDTTEQITRVYISTLRSKKDRFAMNIVKHKVKSTELFEYVELPLAV